MAQAGVRRSKNGFYRPQTSSSSETEYFGNVASQRGQKSLLMSQIELLVECRPEYMIATATYIDHGQISINMPSWFHPTIIGS
jgi:hypothetical protein